MSIIHCVFLIFQFQFLHIYAQTTNNDDVDNYHQDCFIIDDFLNLDVYPADINRFSVSIKRGLWECTKSLLKKINAESSTSNSNMDVSNIFDMETRSMLQDISALKLLITASKPIHTHTIAPAFQWAQSPNEIFISIKFAHKLDAPATLNVESQVIVMANKTLYVKASDGKKVFLLDMEL